MKHLRRSIQVTVGLALTCAVHTASAQTVNVGTQRQFIRGYGGMVHIPWAGDLSASERTLVFGNTSGQLGLTILRIAVPDNNTSDSSYVATAKAATAAGGIVYATPWNAAGAMSSSNFASYATHLSSFVSYMKGQGADLYAISVQNEPDYGAQGGWRTWTAAQCHDFVLQYGDQMGTKLMSCESFNYAKSYYDPILNDSAALAKMGVLGTHIYGTPVSGYAYPLFDQVATGKERWMTEHYTDSTTDANSWPNALGVATELHHAMVEGQFNAYTWWYIKRSYGFINNGAITKRGWCMAHWSKFVRPGFYRVDATASPATNVLLSAYKGASAIVLVLVNNNTAARTVTITVNGSTISSYTKYTTSASKSLTNDGTVSASNGSLSVSLDASSVTTLYGTGSGCSTAADCNDGDVCTTDACTTSTGVCSHAAVTGCCQSATDCNDTNPCTTDSCNASHQCAHAAVSACCQQDSECNDGNACTSDACDLSKHSCTSSPISGCCNGNGDCPASSACVQSSCNLSTHTCAGTPIAGCCGQNSDCDDQNPCTSDGCNTATGACSNTAVSNCCQLDGDCNDGDACTIDVCDLTANQCDHSADPTCNGGAGAPGSGGASGASASTTGGAPVGGAVGTGASGGSTQPERTSSDAPGCACSVPPQERQSVPWWLGLIGVVTLRRRRCGSR